MRPDAVIFALAAWCALFAFGPGTRPLHAQAVTQQYGRNQIDKGPRALGLVQITDTGKARLIPITIMMDGKFFDAGSYKATPVPMALDFGIVYEGFHTGVSQGIFTITQPGQLNHEWIAQGTWLPVGVKAPETSKKYAAPVIEEESKDDRPVLHRRAEGTADKDAAGKDDTKPRAKDAGTASTPPPATTPATGTAPAGGTPPAPTPSASTPPASTTQDTSKNTTNASAHETPGKDSANEPGSISTNDPNRPILWRGKPDPNAHHELFVNFDDPVEAAKAAKDATKDDLAAATAHPVQTVTAISDAGGPDPRPYTYDLKPAEEAIYRNKMFDLAASLIHPKTPPGSSLQPSTTAKGAAGARGKSTSVKTAQPQFGDVSLRIFDLSNSNEPILVFSAKTQPAQVKTGSVQEPQEITLIARTNLEGELQKLFFEQTDSRHLDMRPRMELVDAVDADGDGRGELLFRRISDGGSAYAIYRVTADGLWPLFEGTP